MRNGLKIIDVDVHVNEPPEMWQSYIELKYKERAPRMVKDAHGFNTLLIDNKHYYRSWGLNADVVEDFRRLGRERYGEEADEYIDFIMPGNPKLTCEDLEQAGIDIAFMYASQGFYAAFCDGMDPKLATATCRAYNNWLADFCRYDSSKLRGVIVISLIDPDGAVEELKRGVKELGMRAMVTRPNRVNGRNLGDEAHSKFWETCEDLGVTVSLHVATHAFMPETGADYFKTRLQKHTCSHPLEQQMGMLSLITDGVMERHPGIKFGFLESGCGWLPYWLWRMDMEYEKNRHEAPYLTMKPSEYFKRQGFINMEPEEPYLEHLVQYVGEDKILFSSDYPHLDHPWPEAMDEVDEVNIPEPVRKKWLWDNPIEFYGMKDTV